MLNLLMIKFREYRYIWKYNVYKYIEINIGVLGKKYFQLNNLTILNYLVSALVFSKSKLKCYKQ